MPARMVTRKLGLTTTIGILLVSSAGVALAEDRLPTADERTAVEKVLKAEGFKTWKKIELDEGRWEVDDAIGADGKQYDVDIDMKTMKIVGKKLES